jgi:hypothetical protein
MPDRRETFEDLPNGNIALYYRVKPSQGFLESARELFHLVRDAQERYPDRKRHLYLDIEGHRNKEGGYDFDMLELHSKFLTEFLMPHLTEAHGPLADLKNPRPQDNVIPAVLTIFDQPPDTK